MTTAKTFDYEKSQLETWDFVVLAVYFIAVLGVGIWVRFLCFFITKAYKCRNSINLVPRTISYY